MADAPLKDLYLTCQSCHVRFLHTGGEQSQRRAAGAHGHPDMCPACRALEWINRRQTGHIEWYSRQRGYGFIRQDDGTSLFVHASALEQAGMPRPAAGMQVSYRVQATDRGPRATDVELVTPHA